MSVPHAEKNIRMCQHRNSAVASTALTKVPRGDCLGAKLVETFVNAVIVVIY